MNALTSVRPAPALLATVLLLALSPSLAADPPVPGAPGAPVALANPEVDALLKAAEALRAKGDFAAALAKVSEALRKQPKAVPALLLAGTLEGALGKLDAALGHLRQAVAESPDNLFARKVYASALLQKGDGALALETLQPVLNHTPVDAQAYILAAQVAAGSADFESAHRSLEKALKAEPNSVPGHQLAARLAFAERKPEEGARQLQVLLKLQPDDTDAMLALASLDAEANRLPSAASWLEKARKARPNAPEPLLASAQFALRTGKVDEAAGYLPRLEALLPGQPAMLALKAQVAVAQKHPKEAIVALKAALDKTPATELLVQLHQALLADGQEQEAARRLKAWVDTHGDDLRLRFYAAASAGRAKDYAGAVVQYKAILAKDGNNLLALTDLAQTLELMKDPASLEYAEKAWKLKPDSAATENTLGVILMTAGKNNERGLGLLRDAAQHAPGNPDVRFDYVRALVVTGDKAKAKTELEAVLALKAPFQNEARARELLKTLGGS